MEYLPQGNRAALGEQVEDQILATGKHVVVIGGGDTGADCIGTAHRQGAASVTSLEIMPQPGEDRPSTQPWPTYPMLYRVASAHEEGGERLYAVSTTEFVGDDDGNVSRRSSSPRSSSSTAGRAASPAPSARSPPSSSSSRWASSDPRARASSSSSASSSTSAATCKRDKTFMSSVPGVFVAGDVGRGQSLIVWAIAEGRAAAAGVDAWLTGSSALPRPDRAHRPTPHGLTHDGSATRRPDVHRDVRRAFVEAATERTPW